MVSTSQLNLGPMSLKSIKSEHLNPVNSVNNGVVLVDVIVAACLRMGMQKKEIAAMFGLSAPDFSVAFDTKDEKRNRLMKVALPIAVAREIALQLCEATGMAVAGPDVERNALADVMRSMADYLRVMAR